MPAQPQGGTPIRTPPGGTPIRPGGSWIALGCDARGSEGILPRSRGVASPPLSRSPRRSSSCPSLPPPSAIDLSGDR